MGVGLLNTSQFIALGAAVGKEHQAKATSLFFLSQQLGLLIGASGSAALLNKTFRDALTVKLGGRADSKQVCMMPDSHLHLEELIETGPAKISSWKEQEIFRS